MVTVAALDSPGAPPRVAVPAQKRARLWWLVHQWAGLKFSILLSFILFTGTLAVFSSEIDWLMRPAMRVDVSSVSGSVNWPAIARNAAATHPGYEIRSIDAPIARAFAASLMVKKGDGSLAYLYAHPTTGRIQGEGHWVGAKRVLRNMHRHLNMPIWLGVPIVSSLAFLLLVSLITALVVYKKWWRGFFKPLRTRDARTGWGDFHRLAGVWSLWFVSLMIVTSIWYLVEETVAPAPSLPRPDVPALEIAAPELVPALELGLAAARAADPDLDIERIQFPSKAIGAFKIEGQKVAILVRPRVNAVWTSALTGAPVLLTDGRDLTIHQRISEAADPLHFGTFGGYWTKVAWFGFGLLLTGLSVSGVALYAMRIAKTKQGRGESESLLMRAWQGMGSWRWLSLSLVLIGFALVPTLFKVGGD